MGKLRKIGIVVVVLLIAIVAASFGLGLAQRASIANIQVKSTTPSNIRPQASGIGMDVAVLVHNPDSITATLDQISYSVYANGNFIGSGQTTTTYDIPAKSDYTVAFPISLGWGSTSSTVRSSILAGGDITWVVKGTDNVVINGVSFTVPFDFNGTV